MSITVSWTGIRVIIRSLYHWRTKRKQHLRARMVRLLLGECPLGYVTHRAHFSFAFWPYYQTWSRELIEVFMDDFSVLDKSFDNCLENLRQALIRCEETNLVLNWKKCHFMVKEGIVLGHRISERGIEVDRTEIETIEKLLPPFSVKGIRSFLGHAGFYRRFIKDFSKIANPLLNLLVQGAPFEFDD